MVGGMSASAETALSTAGSRVVDVRLVCALAAVCACFFVAYSYSPRLSDGYDEARRYGRWSDIRADIGRMLEQSRQSVVVRERPQQEERRSVGRASAVDQFAEKYRDDKTLAETIPGARSHRPKGPSRMVYNASLHLYTDEQHRPAIWTFWHSRDNIPLVMRLSYGTMLCHNEPHGVRVHMLHEDDLYEWVDNVHPAFPMLIGAHKADYFRARMLDEYGGIYTDMDTIGMYPSMGQFEHLKDYDIVGMTWHTEADPVAVGTMGPYRAHNGLSRRWVTALHLKLDEKLDALQRRKTNPKEKYPLNWAEMLRDIVKKESALLLQDPHFAYFPYNGVRMAGQLIVTPMGFDRPIEKRNATQNLTEVPFLFWHHSALAAMDTMSFDQIMDSDRVFVEAVAQAYAACRHNEGKPLRPPRTIQMGGVGEPLLKDDQQLRAWIKRYLKDNHLM